MKSLPKFWFASAPIDLEHKQYVLMDFLTSVKDDFTLDFLYPWLSEVQKQYLELSAFKHERNQLKEKFKTIKGFNFEKMCIEYEYDTSWITRDFQEVDSIVEFSIPKFQYWVNKGTKLFDSVSNQMKWEIIGLIPNYKDEGYFILHVEDRDIFVYRYKVEHIIVEEENYFGISTDMVDFHRSRFKNYEDIKHDLIKTYKDLPFPLTLSIQTKNYPLRETLLPIIKRTGLVKIKNGF